MRYIFLFVVTAVLSLGANCALAWGHQGHETVGYIAALLIKGTNAEKQIKKLLKPGETLSTAAECRMFGEFQ
jgi:hypothetical protein